MSDSQSNQEFNPLGKLISLVVLLAAALYFTGWIYRWTYFGFFQLEVTTLNLPVESFYLAAFQTFFGEPFAIFKTIIALILTPLAIIAAFYFIQKIINKYSRKSPLKLNSSQTKIIQFLASFAYELIIVFFILTVLFWLAKWQAESDAWKDAVNETSSLPIVTVIMPKDAPLGRNLDSPLENPAGFRIIGDRNSYTRLFNKELTDTSNPEKPIVWRLLIDRDGYFYIFPALPKKDPKLTIPVIIIYENDKGAQLTILNRKYE